MNESKNKCIVCETPATSRCSRCGAVYYCSRKCQTQHWGAHKSVCAKMKKKREQEELENESGLKKNSENNENSQNQKQNDDTKKRGLKSGEPIILHPVGSSQMNRLNEDITLNPEDNNLTPQDERDLEGPDMEVDIADDPNEVVEGLPLFQRPYEHTFSGETFPTRRVNRIDDPDEDMEAGRGGGMRRGFLDGGRIGGLSPVDDEIYLKQRVDVDIQRAIEESLKMEGNDGGGEETTTTSTSIDQENNSNKKKKEEEDESSTREESPSATGRDTGHRHHDHDRESHDDMRRPTERTSPEKNENTSSSSFLEDEVFDQSKINLTRDDISGLGFMGMLMVMNNPMFMEQLRQQKVDACRRQWVARQKEKEQEAIEEQKSIREFYLEQKKSTPKPEDMGLEIGGLSFDDEEDDGEVDIDINIVDSDGEIVDENIEFEGGDIDFSGDDDDDDDDIVDDDEAEGEDFDMEDIGELTEEEINEQLRIMEEEEKKRAELGEDVGEVVDDDDDDDGGDDDDDDGGDGDGDGDGENEGGDD